MLTVEMLQQSEALSGLTQAQFNAIAEMSRNDENTVIGTKIGALHGQYDSDILSISGIKKKDGEKSYDYAKRVLNEYKTKADKAKDIKDQLTAAQAKVTELQSKIESGLNDETLKQQLKDTKAQVLQLQESLKIKDSELKAKEAEYNKSIKDTHIDYAFKAATVGLKFKPGITEPIQKTLLNAAKAEILAKGTPDFIDDGQGNKKLVMRGTDGNILNNPKNNLNPYTMSELIMETTLKDVIDTGRTQQGGGTRAYGANTTINSMFDIAGAKSQVEADRLIENYLLSNGLTRDSQEFADQSMQLRTDNNVSSLPIR